MSAAPDLKRVTLELGGNDPAIVLDDADPAAVASAIFAGAFNNNGQVCSAIKRVYVPEALYDDVVEGLAAHARSDQGRRGHRGGREARADQQRAPVRAGQGAGRRRPVATAPPRSRAARPWTAPATSSSRPSSTGLSDGTRIVDEEQFGPALPVVAVPRPGRRHRPGQRHPLRPVGLGLGRRRRPGRRGGRAARVRHGVGQHAPRARTAAALRRLQVERHRRGERAVGPGRVLRVPGHAPQRRADQTSAGLRVTQGHHEGVTRPAPIELRPVPGGDDPPRRRFVSQDQLAVAWTQRHASVGTPQRVCAPNVMVL